jgi:hypothetical protein
MESTHLKILKEILCTQFVFALNEEEASSVETKGSHGKGLKLVVN